MNKFLIKFSIDSNSIFVKDFNSKEEAEIFRKSFSEDFYRIREIILRNRLNKVSLFTEKFYDKSTSSVDTIFRNTKNNIEKIIKFNIKYDLNIDIEDIKVYNSSNIVLIEG